MKPFVILARSTAENEVKYYGYDELIAVLTPQANAFMTRALFELWPRPSSSRRFSNAAKISATREKY
jgi:hypothetical protein